MNFIKLCCAFIIHPTKSPSCREKEGRWHNLTCSIFPWQWAIFTNIRNVQMNTQAALIGQSWFLWFLLVITIAVVTFKAAHISCGRTGDMVTDVTRHNPLECKSTSVQFISHLQYEFLKLWLFLLNPLQPPLSFHLQWHKGKIVKTDYMQWQTEQTCSEENAKAPPCGFLPLGFGTPALSWWADQSTWFLFSL